MFRRVRHFGMDALDVRLLAAARDEESRQRLRDGLARIVEIAGDSPELISFVQRAAGYSLTGYTTERVIFILHGVGQNGKSTLLETLRLR